MLCGWPRILLPLCWNLLYHSGTIFDESGATSSSRRGNNAVQIRRWKRSSNTEKQTAQSAMYEDAARNLMERLTQLEEQTIRMRTTVKLRERPQTHTELITLGKPRVSTREPRNLNEWSWIFKAYNEAGSTQLPQVLKNDPGWWSSTVSCAIELDNDSKSLLHAGHVDKVKNFWPRNRQTN